MKGKILMMVIGVLWSVSVLADDNSATTQLGNFPKGCLQTGFHYDGNQIVLDGPNQPGQQQVYLFNNVSHTSIYLDHPAEFPGAANAGWMSQLDSQQWSGLTVSQKNFNWTCQVVGMATLETIPCSQALKVCRFTEKFSKTPVTDEFWVAENGSLTLVLGTIKLRGIDIITKVPKNS